MKRENTPTVSVIIPVYNCEQYLETCVKSVLQQSFSDIEILLVDDGSTDRSPELSDMLASEDRRISVVHKANGGAASARNLGIERASGQWLMFIDADDSAEASIIETLLNGVGSDTDIVMCCCNVLVDNEKVEEHFYSGTRTFISDGQKKGLYLQLMDLHYGQAGPFYTAVGVPWAKIYRKSFVTGNGLKFPVELRRLQDNIFNMYAFHAAREVVYIDQPLYNYRYDHMQSVYQKEPQKILNTFSQFLMKREECLSQIDILQDDEVRRYAEHERFIYLVRMLNFGVFFPGNKMTFTEKKTLADDVCNMACFQSFLKTSKAKNFNSPIEKITFSILKKRQFTLFYLMLVIKRMSDGDAGRGTKM